MAQVAKDRRGRITVASAPVPPADIPNVEARGPFVNSAGVPYQPPSVTVTPRGYVNMAGVSPAMANALRNVAGAASGALSSLDVTSGYRPSGYNRAVGGARGSQHIRGNAVDISLKGMTEGQKQELVRAVLSNPQVNGFGYYPGSQSIHLDVREGPRTYWGANYTKKSFKGPDWMESMVKEWAGGTNIPPPVATMPTPRPKPGAELTPEAVAASYARQLPATIARNPFDTEISSPVVPRVVQTTPISIPSALTTTPMQAPQLVGGLPGSYRLGSDTMDRVAERSQLNAMENAALAQIGNLQTAAPRAAAPPQFGAQPVSPPSAAPRLPSVTPPAYGGLASAPRAAQPMPSSIATERGFADAFDFATMPRAASPRLTPAAVAAAAARAGVGQPTPSAIASGPTMAPVPTPRPAQQAPNYGGLSVSQPAYGGLASAPRPSPQPTVSPPAYGGLASAPPAPVSRPASTPTISQQQFDDRFAAATQPRPTQVAATKPIAPVSAATPIPTVPSAISRNPYDVQRATIPTVQQQSTQVAAGVPLPVARPAPTMPAPGVPDPNFHAGGGVPKVFDPGRGLSVAGRVAGTIAAGPIGGLIGGYLGKQAGSNWLSQTLLPAPTNYIGSSLGAIGAIMSGAAPAGSYAGIRNLPSGVSNAYWSNTGPGGSPSMTYTMGGRTISTVTLPGGTSTVTYS